MAAKLELQLFLKEIEKCSIGTLGIDGLVDTVLRHANLLKDIPLTKDKSADTSNLTLVFSEIAKQIFSQISSFNFNDIEINLSIPWAAIVHNVSTVVNTLVTSNLTSATSNKKRLRYHRQSSRTGNRRMTNKPEFDYTVALAINLVRQQLTSVFCQHEKFARHRGWCSLSAASYLLDSLLSSALDSTDSKNIPGFGFASLSSLFSMTAELIDSLLQSNLPHHVVLYPLIIALSTCLLSMPFYDSTDMRLSMIRWLSIVDELSKSSIFKNGNEIFDICLITTNFLTFNFLSNHHSTQLASNFYGLQNVTKMLAMLRSFFSLHVESIKWDSTSSEMFALLLRSISLFIQTFRLHRQKCSSSSSSSGRSISVRLPPTSGSHCCSQQAESCCIKLAVELSIDIVKISEQRLAFVESSNTDVLLTELVRSGVCCCCFSRDGDIILALLKQVSNRAQSSLFAVNVCIRIFLDYYPRSDVNLLNPTTSCPFFFAKDVNRNEVLAHYVALPLSIFVSTVNLSQNPFNNESPSPVESEETCFQIARQLLALTTTTAFNASSQARHFLFRYLVGPLFDWVLATCFDQTDLFISRKVLPVVLRILENFLGDKDMSYFADFASTSRLSCMSRLFEAGNGFCYIISLIRILVRCPTGGNLKLSQEAASQLEIVRKVAVSTFLPAFYSASIRIANALHSNDENTDISISCHDLQVMSHCFFMLDESSYFADTFVNHQSTEGFVTLMSALEHYITKRQPKSYSKEFIQLFVYIMASLFKLKTFPAVGTSSSFAHIRTFTSHHEFYPLLRLSFDSFCALLSPTTPSIDHWCIIRDYRDLSGGKKFGENRISDSEEIAEDTFTTSVRDLQRFIGGHDLTSLSDDDGTSTADTDYEADEDDEYSIARASQEDEDNAYRETTFGNSSMSYSCLVGHRFYLAHELIRVMCKFIRHSRNCIDLSCPTRLAELTCSLESVLAIITQARVYSFNHRSIEYIFDLILFGDLHPFLLNAEHNWHTIQHLLFCLLANLGTRHVTPRHLCSIFRMTTNESTSLVSAATGCLAKLATLSDYHAPPLCILIEGSKQHELRSQLPVKWSPGKFCFTYCTWLYLEESSSGDLEDMNSDNDELPPIPLCSFGSKELLIAIYAYHRDRQYFEATAEISLNGRPLRRKLHLPFVRNRWHMLALQVRDEMISNKDQYSVSVTAILDCEQVSTASAFWAVEEVPRKEVESKTIPFFSTPSLAVGRCDVVTLEKIQGKAKILMKEMLLPPAENLSVAGSVVFSTWLEAVELLQVYARLPAWLSQPLSSLTSWHVFPSMCVTPKIIDDNPRAFAKPFKQAPEFLQTLCLLLRPAVGNNEATVAAEFVRVIVEKIEINSGNEPGDQTKEKLSVYAGDLKITGKVLNSISSICIVECANFHNSALQVGGPDFLLTWLSSLGSITETQPCRHLLFMGLETILAAIRHPHIYSRFVELEGFEMLYQLLMLKILPQSQDFLDDCLLTILINSSLSRPILTTSVDAIETVFTLPASFHVGNFKFGSNIDSSCRDAGVLVQIPEIWSQILLNSEFLTASQRLTCWRLVFGTVSLLVSSADCDSDRNISSDACAVVSSTATFNRAVFSQMDFPCRCFTILRAFSSASSSNEQMIAEIVLASLGDYLLSLNDPSAVDIVLDFLVALYPLSAFVVDITPTDLFPAFLFSHPYNYRRRPVSSRLSQSSGGGSFAAASLDAIISSPIAQQRRNSSAPTLTPLAESNSNRSTQPQTLGVQGTSPENIENSPSKMSKTANIASPTDDTLLGHSSNATQGNRQRFNRSRRGAGVMVRLIEVLDAILRKHPHSAYSRLFKCIRPETLLFFLGGGSEDLIPSVDFSCRLLHTMWQSLSAAECRIAADLFLKERGPILISFQICRALGADAASVSMTSLSDGLGERSHQSQLFASLCSYYYELLNRNVATLEQSSSDWILGMGMRNEARYLGCKCSSLTQAVKSACPAKVLLSQWWSIPAVELALCSLFSFKHTPESRGLLRMVATEFFLSYTHIRPLALQNNVDPDAASRIWSLLSSKLELIWLMLVATMSSVADSGPDEAIANAAQRLHFESEIEACLTTSLTFVLAILSSNSFSTTSEFASFEEKPGRNIDSPARFISLTSAMSSAFPELGISNFWLLSALKHFEHVCDMVNASADTPQALPIRKSATKSAGHTTSGSQSVFGNGSYQNSNSHSTAVSFTVSEDEEDDDDSLSTGDSQSIVPTFEKAMAHLMQKQSGIIARFVELIASHIQKWPEAPNSGDLAKALLLFVARQVDAQGGNRGIAADAGCLVATCAAAVSAKTIDILFVAEIAHWWLSSGVTALSLPYKQWRNIQAGSFLSAELQAYDAAKGNTFLPTQRSRLKEVIAKLPPPARPSSLNLSSSVTSPPNNGEAVLTKLRRCCDALLPLAERIAEMNQSGREQHHSKRKNLMLTNSSAPGMRVRLQLIEIVRRFAHPAAPMGDASMVSMLYPDEWELDPVECTPGAFMKLRRQALHLPENKIYRDNSRRSPNQRPDDIQQRKSSTSNPSPGKVVTRPTFLECDCNQSAGSSPILHRDWTFLIRTFGRTPFQMNGFLSALIPIISATSGKRSSSGDPRIDLSCQCTLVTPSAFVNGEMFVTEDRVIFISITATVEDVYRQYLFDLHSGVPSLVTFPLNTVSTVYPRRYLLKENSLEVFLNNGKAYFFAFDPESVEIVDQSGHRRKANSSSKPLPLTLAHEICERVRNVLIVKCRAGTSSLPNPNDLTIKWLKGQLTNFEYLTLLNRAGGRSINEMMQYPIFPWVLNDYNSSTIDLSATDSYRDMSKQVPLQPHAPNGEEKVMLRYTQLQAEGSQPYHFPSLYSNSGITAHYLVRLPPFTQACLLYQDGNFDIPDRTFSNFAATWSIADIKELVPEFFYLPEFLVNFCQLNLGICQNGVRVWDVALPPWAGNNPRRFILVHRQALESAIVRSSLPKWIDLIFGFRQIGKGAVDACNVFHPSTYFSSAMTVDLQSLLADPVLFSARQAQIRTYGQVPRQLFEFAHPIAKNTLKKSKTSDTLVGQSEDSSPGKSDMFGDDLSLIGISVGNYAGSHSKLICVWQSELPIDLSLENLVDVEFADSSTLVVLTGSIRRNKYLLPIMANQKLRKRNLLSSNTPATTATSVLNWFSVDVIRSMAGGFSIATTKAWSNVTGSENPIAEVNVNRFYATSHHEITCGPVHSAANNVLLFGTAVGLVLAYFYEISEIDLSSERPDDRLPVVAKTPIQVLCAHETAASIVSLAVSDEFKFFVAGTADGRCVFFDLNSLSFVRQVNLTTATNNVPVVSPIKLIAISRTLGDVAVYFENGHLAMFSVNGSLIGQATASKNVISIEFSSCPEGSSVNSLLVVSVNPHQFATYCAWDLRLVRKIKLEEIPLSEQALIVSQNSAARRRGTPRAKAVEAKENVLVKACYSTPDSQLIAVLSRNALALYSNSVPSAQATAAIKNIKVTLIS